MTSADPVVITASSAFKAGQLALQDVFEEPAQGRKRLLAACRLTVVIMNLTFWFPCSRARIRAMTLSRSSCSALWLGVKSVVTVSALRVVNSPMSRRRVRLMSELKV
jgi:hypothetical protein